MAGSDELLSALVTGTFAELRESGDALLHFWQNRALTAEAELEMIRERIMSLYRGDYMPTPAAIERALYVNSKSIEARLIPETT